MERVDDNLYFEQPRIIRESRLVATMITSKAPKSAYFVSASFCLFVASCTLFFWQNYFGLAEYLPISRVSFFENSEIWRMFTATLIHSDFGHLLSNLPLLFIFGVFLNAYFGKFLFPVLAFLIAGFVNAATVHFYSPDVRLLGASGMVYLVGGLWLGLYWNVQRQYSKFNRVIRILGFCLIIFFPTTFEPQISYRAHFFGLLFGFVLGFVYFLKKKEFIRSFEVYEHSYVEDLPTYH